MGSQSRIYGLESDIAAHVLQMDPLWGLRPHILHLWYPACMSCAFDLGWNHFRRNTFKGGGEPQSVPGASCEECCVSVFGPPSETVHRLLLPGRPLWSHFPAVTSRKWRHRGRPGGRSRWTVSDGGSTPPAQLATLLAFGKLQSYPPPLKALRRKWFHPRSKAQLSANMSNNTLIQYYNIQLNYNSKNFARSSCSASSKYWSGTLVFLWTKGNFRCCSQSVSPVIWGRKGKDSYHFGVVRAMLHYKIMNPSTAHTHTTTFESQGSKLFVDWYIFILISLAQDLERALSKFLWLLPHMHVSDAGGWSSRSFGRNWLGGGRMRGNLWRGVLPAL